MKLTMENGQMKAWFEVDDPIRQNVALSLMIQKGSWWAMPEFGSRLHELRRGKLTDATAERAAGYAEAALAWLIETGRASDVTAAATRRDGGVQLIVTVTAGHGRIITYETFVEVV